MKTSFTKKQLSLAVACTLALGFVSVNAHAQVLLPAAERALVTTQGNQVWMNSYGECWHNSFGPAPQSDVACDPNYKPVAKAPAAKPVVMAAVAPAPQYMVEKITLDADALFDFDKAVLRPEGRATLDGFVGKLNGVDIQKINATGHTDRFGSDRYNHTLSHNRAEAVKTYLVAKGVQSDRVSIEGMGETQPVTKAGDCPGGSKSTKTIACLQPDRRVDVEVTGTRTTQVVGSTTTQ